MVIGLLLSCRLDPSPEPGDVEPAPAPAPRVAAGTPGEANVRIEVSFPERAMQRVTVRTTRRCPESGEAEWWMANWTPGSYVIRDHARHVETITAASVPIRQLAKNRWFAACVPGEASTIETVLMASDLNVRGNFVAETWASLNAPAAFLLPEPPVGPFDVHLELPAEWPDAVAPMPSLDDRTFRAPDLDTLIDSPIVVGDLTTETLTVGGVPHHFVTFGDERTFDREALGSVADLVATQQSFWGDVPYAEYWFLQALVPTYGGLEHYRSTLMMASPSSTETREATIRWLGLVSHEFFHTWNVQRLRPRGLVGQDYENEAHTELLWVAEGWTSYYDDLLLVRAGIIDEGEYLELLGRQIERLEERPGRRVQSLAAASFNAWTKFYQPTPHQLNSTIGYYTKGAVVAFLLDAEIRRATAGRYSLDDLARRLRERSEAEPEAPLAPRLASMGARRAIRGIVPADVREIASELARRDLSAFFERTVDQPGDLDYGSALQWFGLTLVREDPEPRLGVHWEARDSRIVVTGVLRDSPAWAAGLHVDDELLTLDAERITADRFDALVARCEGRSCDLVRSRQGQAATVTVQPEPMPATPKLQIDEGASPIASRRRADWLGQ